MSLRSGFKNPGAAKTTTLIRHPLNICPQQEKPRYDQQNGKWNDDKLTGKAICQKQSRSECNDTYSFPGTFSSHKSPAFRNVGNNTYVYGLWTYYRLCLRLTAEIKLLRLYSCFLLTLYEECHENVTPTVWCFLLRHTFSHSFRGGRAELFPLLPLRTLRSLCRACANMTEKSGILWRTVQTRETYRQARLCWPREGCSPAQTMKNPVYRR